VVLINFNWLVGGEIAGMGQPGGYGYQLRDGRERLARDLDLLSGEGIRAVVSLTEDPLAETMLRARDMSYLHLPVADMEAPTLEDALKFMEFTRKAASANRPLVVHCGAGKGRTGTMLACYLVERGMGPGQALARVRRVRPGSVETAGQEDTVRDYSDHRRTLVRQSA
jgi:atypical dual specificity phosphatase